MRLVLTALLVVTLTSVARAQEAEAEFEPDAKAWEFSASLYTYFIPDSHEYLQPTITADRDWLHLELRYNYEDQNTASVWAGYNFAGTLFDEKVEWELTPMIGGVFGDTSGVAPGYNATINWWKLELYSEGEYVFDCGGNSDNHYFYNWSEFTIYPAEWFRVGIVTQRTRAYESDRDIQRGLLVGVTWKQFDVAGYLVNPDDDPIFMLGVSFDF